MSVSSHSHIQAVGPTCVEHAHRLVNCVCVSKDYTSGTIQNIYRTVTMKQITNCNTVNCIPAG